MVILIKLCPAHSEVLLWELFADAAKSVGDGCGDVSAGKRLFCPQEDRDRQRPQPEGGRDQRLQL